MFLSHLSLIPQSCYILGHLFKIILCLVAPYFHHHEQVLQIFRNACLLQVNNVPEVDETTFQMDIGCMNDFFDCILQIIQAWKHLVIKLSSVELN